MKMKVVTDGEKNTIDVSELERVSGRQIVCHNTTMNWVWLLVKRDGVFQWVNIEDSTVYFSKFDNIKEAIEADNDMSDIEHYVFDTRVEFGEWLAGIGEVKE